MTRRGVLWVVAGVLAAATAVAVAVASLPRTREIPRSDPTRAASSAPAAPAAAVSPAPGDAEAMVDSEPAAAVRPAGPAASLLAPRWKPGESPLARSPGYYPPDDPESASVRLGRREAPVVPDLFQGGAGSLEEFGRLVVEALNARDERALHRLRVTRAEFEKILWREFPESRPVTNITAEDAWSMSEPRSLVGASRAMGLHGGRRLRFLTIESADVQPYTNFLLHRDVLVTAVDETTAEIHELALAPSVAERKGRFKALLYRD